MLAELTRQLKGEEGTSRCVYFDTLGFATVGVGRLVDARKPGAGLRPSEIDFMLRNDIEDRVEALTRALPWFQNLDDARRAVLVGMAFQLGTDGLLKFVTTLDLVRRGLYDLAADAMKQSRWAQQTPARAERMATQMRTGQFTYAPGA